MRNRFKGLDLIDRLPDELWMEVRDIVQETGIKTIPPRKRNAKKQNGMGIVFVSLLYGSKIEMREVLSCGCPVGNCLNYWKTR